MKTRLLNLVLVDDNEDDLILIEEALEGLPVVIQKKFEDGSLLLEYLLGLTRGSFDNMPHIIVMDINMPGKNGFEVLADIRADRYLGSIPVIFFSTSAREEDIERARELGVSSYIHKPRDFEAYRKLFHQLIEYWEFITSDEEIKLATGP